ncbi:MAG: hypothetical protein Q8L98_07190 [Chlamydiales bacterium]|nr:hypothetical protein [Chlamydiales bacterium]
MKKKALERPQPDLKIREHIYEGWVIFNKALKNLEMKNYLLRVVPLRCPDAYEITFINVSETIRVLTEHYDLFKKATNIEFDPHKIVLEAQDPQSTFWKRVFSMENHLAKGLLFGFGLKNSLLGDRKFSNALEKEGGVDNQFIALDVSTDPVEYGEGSINNFNIPLFGTSSDDEIAEKYRREKKIIEEVYRNNDMKKVTFQRLSDLFNVNSELSHISPSDPIENLKETVASSTN